MKKTVVIGASDSPSRYSYLAVTALQKHGHPVFPVGIREGQINGLKIITDRPALSAVDTVTLYISPKHHDKYLDYILSLHPKRIIFNPGTESPSFEQLARSKGIEVVEGCTLVMLSIGAY